MPQVASTWTCARRRTPRRSRACWRSVSRLDAGAQHPADAVERVTGAAAVAVQVCCWTRWRQRSTRRRPGRRRGTGPSPRPRRERLGGGGLEAGEAVHGDDLDPGAERGASAAASQSVNTSLDRPSTMSSRRAGPVPSRTGVRSMTTVTNLSAAAGVAPAVLIDAEHAHAVEAGRVVDQQRAAGGEDGVVDGVPGERRAIPRPGRSSRSITTIASAPTAPLPRQLRPRRAAAVVSCRHTCPQPVQR